MSNPTRTSLLAAAVKDGVAFIPLAIAPAAVTELFTNSCEVGVYCRQVAPARMLCEQADSDSCMVSRIDYKSIP